MYYIEGERMTNNNDLIEQLNVKLEDAYLVCKDIAELIESTKDNEMKQYLIIECGKAMDKHYEQMKGI